MQLWLQKSIHMVMKIELNDFMSNVKYVKDIWGAKYT